MKIDREKLLTITERICLLLNKSNNLAFGTLCRVTIYSCQDTDRVILLVMLILDYERFN